MGVAPISQQSLKQIEEIEGVELVVGIVADIEKDGLEMVYRSLQSLPGSPRIAVLKHDRSGGTLPQTNSGADDKHAALSLIPWTPPSATGPSAPIEIVSSAYQSVFATADKLGARACCVIVSTLEQQAHGWARQLMRPLLEEDIDLVSPYFTRRTFEGLLNSSIVHPLTRCLYGNRIHNPLGPDLGVSRRLFQKLLRPDGNARSSPSPMYPLESITPTALCGNLKVGQVHVGARIYTPTDWTNVSSLLAQVLGPVFFEIQRNAACWQRTRESTAVREFGQPIPVAHEVEAPDTSRMVESFQLAYRDLQEIWSIVLPPATLFQLTKLARLPADRFRMSDELWVRIVFDFALAHRLRTINRDHLLGSMTPLYLGWVASYVSEVKNMDPAALEQRLERLSVVYEAGRPYFISRWRWPDRFNP